MITKRQITFLLATAVLVLGSLFCSTRVVDTTGGSEVTNGVAMLSDGTPASNAEVLLIDRQNWFDRISAGESPVIVKTATDEHGKFTLEIPAGSSFNIIIRDSAQGIIIPDSAVVFSDTLVCTDLGNYTVSFTGQSEKVKEVMLAGTDINVTNSDKSSVNYNLEKIPQSSYCVIAGYETETGPLTNAVTALSVKPGSLSQSDTLEADTSKALPLDDFNDRDNRGIPGTLLGGGYWEVYSDEYTGGTSSLISPADAAPLTFASAIQSGGTGYNTALHMEYTTGTAGVERNYPFVYASLRFGQKHYDLSTMESLKFHARGSGSIIVEFVQYPSGGEFFIAAYQEFPLSGAWQEYIVDADSLDINVLWFDNTSENFESAMREDGLPVYDNEPASWTEMDKKADRIQFVCTGGSELWVDNIKMKGITLKDLIEQDD